MGAILDSISLLNGDQKNGRDTVVLPYGELERSWPITLPDGEQVMSHVDSYNNKTNILKLSFTDKAGKKHLWELELHTRSEAEVGAESEEQGFEIPLFSVSGKLVYLTQLNPA